MRVAAPRAPAQATYDALGDMILRCDSVGLPLSAAQDSECCSWVFPVGACLHRRQIIRQVHIAAYDTYSVSRWGLSTSKAKHLGWCVFTSVIIC